MTLYNIPGVGLIPPGVPFSLTTTLTGPDGPYEDVVKYPANWLANADAGWLDDHGIEVVEPPEPEPEPIDLASYAAERRRELVNGSAVIDVGERTIPTWVDPESRGAITGLVVASGIVPDLTAPWKGSDGEFYILTAAEITALALGIMGFVQECFAAEAAVLAGLSSDPPTITSVEDIDNADWPSNT